MPVDFYVDYCRKIDFDDGDDGNWDYDDDDFPDKLDDLEKS